MSVNPLYDNLMLILGVCGHWWQAPMATEIWGVDESDIDCPVCGRVVGVVISAWEEIYPPDRPHQTCRDENHVHFRAPTATGVHTTVCMTDTAARAYVGAFMSKLDSRLSPIDRPKGTDTRRPAPYNGRLIDLIGTTAKNRRLYLRNDCDGSPNCVAELHIEDTVTLSGAEIHLTSDEVRTLIDGLTDCLDSRLSPVDRPKGTDTQSNQDERYADQDSTEDSPEGTEPQPL